MGKVVSTLTRPVKQYNIEERAHKVISRDKPIPAPPRKSTKKQLEIAQKINPSFMEDQYKKDADLDDRLKNIFVLSRDPQLVTQNEPDPSRPLPKLTRSSEEFQYGFWEPSEAREGKCSLGNAMAFMADHMEDPVQHTVEKIAAKYKLDHKDAENVLEYYRVFKVIVPDKNPRLAYTDRSQIEAPKEKE